MRLSKKYLPILILQVSVYTTGFASNCQDAEALYKQAKQTKKLDKQIELYTQSGAICDQFYTQYKLGIALFKDEQLEKAKRSFHRALGLAASAKTEALAQGRLAYVAVNSLDVVYTEALARMDIAFEKYNSINTIPPKWMQGLRKHIEDSMQINGIVESSTITRTLSQRGFKVVSNVKPKIDLRILFDLNKATLSRQGRNQIAELKVALQTVLGNKQHLKLVGHTDSQGDEYYNQELSERRARSVHEELSRLDPGLSEYMQVSGRGESQLLYHGDNSDDHRRNRRVEVRLQ